MQSGSEGVVRVGLCAMCTHVRIIRNDRGSVFYQCQLGATDPRFPPYPRLPRLECDGFKADKTPDAGPLPTELP